MAYRLTSNQRSKMENLNLVTFLDDASRCITEFSVFENVVLSNTILVLKRVIRRYSALEHILSDYRTQFTASCEKKNKINFTKYQTESLKQNITQVLAHAHSSLECRLHFSLNMHSE